MGGGGWNPTSYVEFEMPCHIGGLSKVVLVLLYALHIYTFWTYSLKKNINKTQLSLFVED